MRVRGVAEARSDLFQSVIGSLMRDGVPFSMRTRRMPACTLFSIGSVECSLGSGRPSEICMLRTADRYPLTVWGARPWSAKNEAKQQSNCSATGNGVHSNKKHESVSGQHRMSCELTGLDPHENISELPAPSWRDPICLRVQQEIEEVVGSWYWLRVGFWYLREKGG